MPAPLDDERSRLAGHYRNLNDLELTELAAQSPSLTPTARELLRSEIQRRGVALAVLDSAAAPPASPNLVRLRRFRDLPDALIAQSVLDSAAVDCFLFDENYLRLDWFRSYFIGGVKLMVSNEDARDAATLLDAKHPDSFLASTGEFVQPRCPVCQSYAVSFMPLIDSATYALTYFGVPLSLRRESWFCSDCRHQWSPSGEPLPELHWPIIAALWTAGCMIAILMVAVGLSSIIKWIWCGYILLAAVCLARFAVHRKYLHAFIVGFVVGCMDWLALCTYLVRHGDPEGVFTVGVVLFSGMVYLAALHGFVIVAVTWLVSFILARSRRAEQQPPHEGPHNI
jgi:hypothetical protein